MLFNRKKGSVNLSLPKNKTIHGIEVSKVPVGKYIASMQDVQDLPKTIMESVSRMKTCRLSSTALKRLTAVLSLT